MKPLQSIITLLLLAGVVGCDSESKLAENTGNNAERAITQVAAAKLVSPRKPAPAAVSASDESVDTANADIPHLERPNRADLPAGGEVRRKLRDEAEAQLPPMSEAERQALFAKREQMKAEWQQAARKNIHSKEAEKRLEAVRDLDADDLFDFGLLLDALNRDDSAEVRAEVAGKLGFGEYPQAIPELLTALNDRSDQVVLAAIESLSWYYESSDKAKLSGALAQLREHASEQVGEAAGRALELIAD